MTTHANCDHEATKSARAKCRAGKGTPRTDEAYIADEARAMAADKLRTKAAASTKGKVSKPKHEEGNRYGASSRLFQSGHCDAGRHKICTGQYTLTPCSCPCHAAAEGDDTQA